MNAVTTRNTSKAPLSLSLAGGEGLVVLLTILGLTVATARAEWLRHTIDSAGRGADGVRLADIDGDGRLDIVTPWEEEGEIRVYFNPGPARCRANWPRVTVGRVKSPEDAVMVDLDGDFVLDVVSCAEGATRQVHVHWGPVGTELLRDAGSWTSQSIPALEDLQMWMFAVPLDIDGRNELDLVLGGKGAKAGIGWIAAPDEARELSRCTYHPLRPAGWIMSLVAHDMDGDGDKDVLASDRKGPRRGVFWLENPGPERAARPGAWTEHALGGQQCEVMFLDLCDLDGDQRQDVLVATRNSRMLWYRQDPAQPGVWQELAIANPFGVRFGKAVRVGDIDLDGVPDIVHTANTQQERAKRGVCWLRRQGDAVTGPWQATDVSGPRGAKFDLIQLLDLDGDGDLDVLTCEENDQLGVLWYENPTRSP